MILLPSATTMDLHPWTSIQGTLHTCTCATGLTKMTAFQTNDSSMAYRARKAGESLKAKKKLEQVRILGPVLRVFSCCELTKPTYFLKFALPFDFGSL